MKKGMLSLVLSLAVLTAVPMSVSAETMQGSEDWAVTFDGSKMESNFGSSQLDEVIYGMQPGDTAQFQITVSNRHSKEADWYMSNEIVTSMEDSTEASGGAYEYLLTYTDAGGTETVLYSSETVGGEKDESDTNSEEGLHGVDSALGEMFYLDRLASGASGRINLEVKLDGETLGNSYQSKLAKLEMQFAAEEAAADQVVTTSVPGKRAVTVRTGDTSQMMLYISLAALALGLVLVILALRRVRRDQEDQTAGADGRTRRSGRREGR